MSGGLLRAGKDRLQRALEPAAARAARRYVAGTELEDALRLCRALDARGTRSTIGYWNDPTDPVSLVDAQYLACLDALGGSDLDGYLSVKVPALRFDPDLLHPLLRRAAAGGVRVHFDSLGPEHADRTWQVLETASAHHPDLGCTLPGRWRRSVEDVDRAVAGHWRVRIVKGQWEDPDAQGLDPREGYLEVAKRLAGRAHHVAVATHDVALAERVVGVLQAARTPCELELLHGLPMRAARRLARRRRLPLRVYVPYGASWLPYTMDVVRRNPRILGWMLLDRMGF
ncbi:MAG: proline dehydrogenase [Planctomycetota bacterium]